MTEERQERPKDAKQRAILVLGSGVIGLTVAHVLSEDPANKITVLARELVDHFFSQGWASPWAGANWSPLGPYEDERQLRWEKTTFEKFWSMIPSGMVMPLPFRQYTDNPKDFSEEPRWKGIARDFRPLSKEELPEGFVDGFSLTSLSVKPAKLLPWLVNELKGRGVTFVHRAVGSIEEAAALGGPDCIVVNATGMGARTLLGVADLAAYPIRGQTIFVEAPSVKAYTGSSKNNEYAYIIPRPDGTVTLGGTFEPDNTNLSVDMDIARGIYERCTALEPKLKVENGAKIISHNVGLRPARHGGPRVELEAIQLPLKEQLIPDYGLPRPRRELKVVHAYGLGPAGYQSSWGVAEEVASIVSKL